MIKRLIILIVLIMFFSLSLFIGYCAEVNAGIFSKNDISKAMELLNENEYVLLNVQRLDRNKKLFTCNLDIEKDTVNTIYNYLISHNINIDYLQKSVNNVLLISLNKIIEDIYVNNDSINDEKVLQSNYFIQEFGIYNDLSIIKEHLIFYLVIWNPDYHIKKQYDIALDKDFQSIILNDTSAINTLIRKNKVSIIKKDDIFDLLKLYIKKRKYNDTVSIDRELSLVNEDDIKIFNNKKISSPNHKYRSSIQKTSIDIHRKFSQCIKSHYLPILINSNNSIFNVVFFSYVEYRDPLGVPLYKLYSNELNINANGEITSESKTEISCEPGMSR